MCIKRIDFFVDFWVIDLYAVQMVVEEAVTLDSLIEGALNISFVAMTADQETTNENHENA